MKKRILSLLFVFILLLCGCSNNTKEQLPTTSWVENIEWSEIEEFEKPLPYIIMGETYYFPLNYEELSNNQDIYVLDYVNSYADNYYHFIPFNEFYGSDIVNWQVPLFQLVSEGNVASNQTQCVGKIKTDNTEYVFKTIGVLAFLYDGKFDENNIPSCQVGVNCLAQNGFIITSDIKYDTVERHNVNIIQLQDLISNYLGKPTNIYCSCELAEIPNQTEIITTYLLWEYEDGQVVTLQCSELNTTDGLKLQIGGFTYTPASWSEEESWKLAIEDLNSNFIDVTDTILQ